MPNDIPSFPTRRSSDLRGVRRAEGRRRAALLSADGLGRRSSLLLCAGLCLRAGGELPGVIALRIGERSEEHTSELQSQFHLVCRLLHEKKNIRLMINSE